MPPSRFLAQSSKWRNAVATPAKPDGRYEELGSGYATGAGTSGIDEVKGQGTLVKIGPWPLSPSATDADGNASSDAAAERYGYRPTAFTRGSAPGSLLLVDLTHAGRKGKQVPSVAALAGNAPLADFDIAPWWSMGNDGTVVVAAASTSSDKVQLTRISKPLSTTDLTTSTLTAGTGGGFASVQFHPTVPGLLLAAGTSTVSIWQTARADAPPSITLNTDTSGAVSLRHAAWNSAGAGNQVGATTSDGYVSVWDARAGSTATSKVLAHQSKVKPSRLCFVRESALLLTTGFSQMRQREISIWDPRSLASPLKKLTLTDSTSPSVLTPIVDHDRGIVYLVGRGDTAVKWIEVDGKKTFNDGSHPLGPGLEAAGPAAIAPQTMCDVMQAEIDRLYVPIASTDGLLPLKINVPRRQLIDYHEDLFPDTVSYFSPGFKHESDAASSWLSGKDVQIPLLSRDPAKVDVQLKQLDSGNASSSVPATQHAAPTAAPAVQDSAPAASDSRAEAARAETSPAVKPPSSVVPAPAPVPAAAATGAPASVQASEPVAPSGPKPASEPAASVAAPSSRAPRPAAAARAAAPANPNERPQWSRRFLAGSTPLVSAHQNLSALDTSTSPDARAFDVNATYLFYPVSGPGGRIGFHPLSAHGRMPLSPPSVRSTSKIVDFVVDPFSQNRLISAHEDGKVRIWALPDAEKVTAALSAKDQTAACAELDVSEPITTLDLPSLCSAGRIVEVKAHPTAKDVVAAVLAGADDESRLVLWDAAAGSVAEHVQVGTKGCFGFSWSPLGRYVAVAGRDKTIRVCDPRVPSEIAELAAHDSPRSFKTVWIDEQHLITTGHGAGSTREIKLYACESSNGKLALKVLRTLPLDNSPAVLFPHYDADTNILFLFSRGDRSVSAFEVYPNPPPRTQQISALPVWQASSPQVSSAFLPKRCADVKQVEVAVAYRLSQKEVQRVAWNFSRARPEFFQDDIFIPTLDVETPLCSAADWLAGQNPEPRYISLQPEGMTKLSQAPAKQTTSKLQKGPIKRELTEEERKERLLDNIFSKAKVDPAEAQAGKEDKPQLAASVRAAPDDDDWSD